MASWSKYEPFLKRWEGYGKYTNRPTDKGGPTMSGVTLTKFREVYGREKTIADLRGMTETQWRAIMKSYWDKVKGDKILRQCVADMMADWHINSGIGGIKAAQRALGTTADGIVGEKTLALLNRPDAFDKLQDARCVFYCNLAINNLNNLANITGWMRRLIAIKER